MPTFNKTKVVATVGPACWDKETLAFLIREGVDVFRLNFSHGTAAEHETSLANIRAAAASCDAVVAVMGDLCGPKIRVGQVEGDRFDIAEGDSLRIMPGEFTCTPERICTSYDTLCDDVRVGQRVLIDDGHVRLRAVAKEEAALVCRCETGGAIGTRKGVNLPDTQLSLPSLTDKDREDLVWAVEHELDYLALSFVRSAEDLIELRRALKGRSSDMQVVSKIERPEAIERLDEIIELSDAVMVARGDLGVEMDVSRVPLIQKDITHRCARVGKPVIIATQMLQTMVESPAPTRAEVSDVANAILDGADAVMLSAETSVGLHPIEALHVIRAIANETEAFLAASPETSIPRISSTAMQVTSAIAHGASIIGRELQLRLIAVWTESGATVRLLSKRRPPQRIAGLTGSDRVCRRMCLYYGVEPIRMERTEDYRQMVSEVGRALQGRDLAAPGDRIAVLAGTHLRQPGATNVLLIHLIAAPDEAAASTTG